MRGQVARGAAAGQSVTGEGARGAPPPAAPAMTVIDALRQRPFPARRERSGSGASGPGFHLVRLWESAPLWDADPADVQEIRADCAGALEALTAAVSARWGRPTVLELTEHREREVMGLPIPAPLDLLCGRVSRIRVWEIPSGWVAAGAGQQGPELPYELWAAVGEGPAARLLEAPAYPTWPEG